MSEVKTIKLGRTGDYYYLGFCPPLENEELADFPQPRTYYLSEDVPHDWRISSVETFDGDNSMDIGFSDISLGYSDEKFVLFAEAVAELLGDRVLDSEIHFVGPGSVTAQAQGALAQY